MNKAVKEKLQRDKEQLTLDRDKVESQIRKVKEELSKERESKIKDVENLEELILSASVEKEEAQVKTKIDIFIWKMDLDRKILYSEISISLCLDFIDNLDFIDLLLTTNNSIQSRFHCIILYNLKKIYADNKNVENIHSYIFHCLMVTVLNNFIAFTICGINITYCYGTVVWMQNEYKTF